MNLSRVTVDSTRGAKINIINLTASSHYSFNSTFNTNLYLDIVLATNLHSNKAQDIYTLQIMAWYLLNNTTVIGVIVMIVLSYSYTKRHPLLFRDFYTTLKYFNTWTDTIHHYTSHTYNIISLLVLVLSWLYICNSYNNDFDYEYLHSSVIDYTQQVDDGLDEEINSIDMTEALVTLLVSVFVSISSHHLGYGIDAIMKLGQQMPYDLV